MHATTEILYQIIYPNLNRELLLADLNPKRQNNNEYIQLDCPGCFYKQEAFIKDSFYTIKCNRRNNCGREISIWDYVQKKYTTENNKETLEKLASLAGVELPKLSEQDLIVIDKSQKTSSLINTVQSYFIEQLWSSVGVKALEYLTKSRGYTEDQIKIMGIGFNPGYQQTHVHLLNNHALLTANVTDKLNFIEYRDNHPITFLHRDIHGKPLTIWGRTLQQDEKDKYKPYSNSTKETPFNLYKSRNLNDQILVEGYFCSMIAHAHGLYNVTAVNTNSITTAQIETLKQTKAKRIYLAFGHDKAGKAGTKKSIELLLEHNFEVFIVSYPIEYTDIDQYITKTDINSFKKDVEQAISSSKWLSEYMISQHNHTTDSGRKDCINEILNTAKLIKSSTDRIDFISQSKILLHLTDEHIKTYEQELQNQAIQEQFEKETKLYADTIQKLLHEKRFDEIASVPKPRILSDDQSIIIQPYGLLELTKDLLTTTPGLKTQYNDLDEYVTIPNEAITLIAGRPSHGKTALTLNLLLNMIKAYPSKTFYLFSYEETCKQISLKIINILSQYVIDEKCWWKNLNNLEGYLKSSHGFFKKIEDGKALFDNYVKNNRLIIIDKTYEIEKLRDLIVSLQIKNPNIGAIFIDYIQKIPNKEKSSNRQLELQRTSEILLDLAKTSSLPLILGAQLGRDINSKDKVKLSNLRESGDLEQDANLVLGIFNPSMETEKDEEESIIPRNIEFRITPLKNRNGLANKTIKLNFDKATLKITTRLA